MTAEGAGRAAGPFARGARARGARPWAALRDLSDRTSLRTKLITGLLALVIVAIAAISISGVWVLRSYLTSQDDSQLRSIYTSAVSQGVSLPPGEMYRVGGTTNFFVGVQEPGNPLSASGLQSGPSYGGYRQVQSVPDVPASQLWAITNNGKLMTVQAESGSDTWRVITEPVSYPLSS